MIFFRFSKSFCRFKSKLVLSDVVGTEMSIFFVPPLNPHGAFNAHFNFKVSGTYTHNVLPNPTPSKDVSDENASDFIERFL